MFPMENKIFLVLINYKNWTLVSMTMYIIFYILT
jgi:hypothetical protein